MHKIIHKLIRYSRRGVNVVAGLNAAISTTGDGDGISVSSVRSSSHIVQRSGRSRTASRAPQPNEKEVKHGETEG